MFYFRPLVSMRYNRVSRPIRSSALVAQLTMTAFCSKEDDDLFYKIINAKDTSKETIFFLIKQRDNAAAKEKLVIQAENEKLVIQAENEKLVMQAVISTMNTKLIDAQREINSNTPRDIIGNSPTFSFHNFILA